mgnify:CR=1 FL=1
MIFALTVVCFAGCGKKAEVTDESAERITFVLDWSPNTNHTGIYVAQALHFFEDEGLSVKIVSPPEDGAASLVAAGKADFGVDFQDTLAPAFAGENPLPVTAVATVLQHNTSGLLSKKSTGIVSPKDLENHSYASWDNPIELAMVEYVVEKDGGDFDKVQVIPTTVTDPISALNTQVDVLWSYEGWDAIAVAQNGLEINFMPFREIDPAFDYYTPVIIANNTFLQEHPDTTKRFLAALEKGYTYAAQNPEQAADILCEAAPEIDPMLVQNSQQFLSSFYLEDGVAWGYIDPARWNAYYQWLYDNGLLSRPIGNNVGFTNEFLGGV